jgi:hypothetical protein
MPEERLRPEKVRSSAALIEAHDLERVLAEIHTNHGSAALRLRPSSELDTATA